MWMDLEIAVSHEPQAVAAMAEMITHTGDEPNGASVSGDLPLLRRVMDGLRLAT